MDENSISICIPCYRQVDSDVINALFHLDVSGLSAQVKLLKNLEVASARNMFAEKTKSDYIFFVDSDIILPSDTLKKLLSDKKDIVSGLVFRRKWPYPPVILYKNPNSKTEKDKYIFSFDYPSNGLVECDAVGMACTLIKTEVFRKVEYPWFRHLETTEDIFFCEKAVEKGYKIFVDTSVRPIHIDEMYITEMEHLAAKRDMILLNRKEQGDTTYFEA